MIVSSSAGAPLSQTGGAAAERAAKDSAANERGVEAEFRSERSAGVGQAEGDERAGERDADGRRLWERPAERQDPPEQEREEAGPAPPLHGQADHPGLGETLDLVG